MTQTRSPFHVVEPGEKPLLGFVPATQPPVGHAFFEQNGGDIGRFAPGEKMPGRL